MMSAEPPGGKGVTSLSGLDGNAWASACPETSIQIRNANPAYRMKRPPRMLCAS